ncbi:type I polyketide synthase [Streptomyces oryzae]|uniref:Type I polyketide synthase n=1 Tax=Streptomyces oryzae TaxID=1434886 RepID=A0ABS3XI12_9ACTN|nr:type I polyketide synthase [Streptomyces oryzae]MBO8194632.1 type I polyketide synthase [Streptomyces oryzae]
MASDDAHTPRSETGPIAVIGMGCRLPGDVDSPAALWRLLTEGRDAVGEPPSERQDLLRHSAAASRNGTDRTPVVGGYLKEVAGFDAEFFGVSGREADVLDPQHRLLLEVVWEALEHAGLPHDRLTESATGVFTGLSYNDYMDGLAGHPQELESSILTNGHCVAAGRISYLLGLRGPCVALDTACSSSLVAVHLACQSLQQGECDLALAGGVTLMLQSRITRSFTRMGMLSPTGRCHTFDAAADGFVRGEGCGAVVLKRLSDAVRDGDRVLAIVRGSAVNQDGRSDGLAAPSPDAQRDLLGVALERAAVDPGDVGLIETHGTGTPVGDPVEFASLAEVYGSGKGRCALGSVKTNLGHLEPAAGVTGLIKAVLCLRYGQVPPNLHFERWNPAIDAADTRLFVPTEMTRWPVDTHPRLAAVSSFGFSGTNAHVVLQQAPATRRRDPAARLSHGTTTGPSVLLVPAGSRNVLPTAAGRLADWLDGDGATVPLQDVCHTLAVRRNAGRGRLGVVGRTRTDMTQALRAFADGRPHPAIVCGEVGTSVTRQPVWVFSGQGSQWPGMGCTLLEREPVFASALAEVDPLIAEESGFSVLQLLRAKEPISGCGQVQPALFALQVALAATWRSYGVEPAAVIGHSMGEVAAAVIAGALTVEDGVRVICRRSRLLTRIAGQGAMATVGLDPAQVEADIDAHGAGKVSVAVLSAPESTVVAGDAAQIEQLTTAWEQRGVPAMPVAVDVASHCHHVDPLLPELRDLLAGLDPRSPQVPFYSTVLDDPGDKPAFDADYWCANLRRPVRFSSAVTAAASDRNLVYTEISPHPVVTHPLSQNLAPLVSEPVVLPTLRRDEEEDLTFRTQLVAAHCAGVSVDWSALYTGADLADVPVMTFDRQHHWVQPAPCPAAEGDGPSAAEGLLGRHRKLPGDPVRHSWQGNCGTAALPWLTDHRVLGTPVMPGALSYAVALNAACEALDAPADQVQVTDLAFHSMLQLGEHTDLATVATAVALDRAECEMFGRGGDGQWIRHASAVLRPHPLPSRPKPASVSSLTLRHPVELSPESLYAGLRSRGLEHGPAFTGISELHTTHDRTSFWARIALPSEARTGAGDLRIDPVVVDLCLQMVVARLTDSTTDSGGVLLPVQIRSARILGDPATAAYCHTRISEATPDTTVGHARLLDRSGVPVLALDGVQFAHHTTQQHNESDHWLLEPSWHRTPEPGTDLSAPAGNWLIVGEGDDNAENLAAALRTAGARTEVWDVPLGDKRLDLLGASLEERLEAEPAARHALVMLCSPSPGSPSPGSPSPGSAEPHNAALTRTRRLLHITQTLANLTDPPRLYVLTHQSCKATPTDTVDLGHGSLRGLVRVLAMEHPELRAVLLDADTGPGAPDAARTARELLSDAPDDEVALRGAERLVARLEYAPPDRAERAPTDFRTVRYGEDGFRLRIGRPGDLGSLEFAVSGRREPQPGEVELQVQAAGVNFRDVLTTMGLLPGDDDVRYRIGYECAGRVTAVGPGVEHLSVGDHVLAATLEGGAFASFVTVPAAAVAPMPAGLPPSQAAGLPVAFLTAWYALRYVGQLAEGERVLIHSASGGTGLAAIAVARRLGAQVLATAGSEEKRRYLHGMGIETVMDSRSLDFTEQTLEATDGQGVDVVLNSLSGAAIRAGLDTLRPFGRFVELGMRDILSDAPVGLAPFRHNITMRTVDLIGLQRQQPGLFADLFREVMEEFAEGRLKPFHCTTSPLGEATDTFRTMAGADHIGKLVLTVPDHGEVTAALPPEQHIAQPDGTYVVTGGLRGLGLATARWLADQGAGRLILNGRTPPTSEAAQAISAMVGRGSEVRVVLGDISDPETAERLAAAASENGSRLRGIVHCAMVLDDAAVTNIREEQLQRVWGPKADGAWNLHNATADSPPDWFVLFSSMASLLGNPGQGAYAAANSWLDTFAAWRSSRGMPTLAVNWGPWGETGAATDFADRGYRTIPTDQGLDALGTLLSQGRVRTGVIPGEPETWVLPAVRRSSFFSRVTPQEETQQQATPADADIASRLREAEPGLPRRTLLENYLADHIRAVLRLGNSALDPQTPLKNLGFDSLLSMELRVRLEAELGVKLPTTFVRHRSTITALAEGLAEHMGLDL